MSANEMVGVGSITILADPKTYHKREFKKAIDTSQNIPNWALARDERRPYLEQAFDK